MAYPDRPGSIADTETVVAYVEAFERAYRRNALVERWGVRLVGHGFYLGDTRTYDAPDHAAVVRLRYQLSTSVEQSDGSIVVNDSTRIFVTYYVDESVVVRAEDDGPREDPDALDPDPWTAGEPVACFE